MGMPELEFGKVDIADAPQALTLAFAGNSRIDLTPVDSVIAVIGCSEAGSYVHGAFPDAHTILTAGSRVSPENIPEGAEYVVVVGHGDDQYKCSTVQLGYRLMVPHPPTDVPEQWHDMGRWAQIQGTKDNVEIVARGVRFAYEEGDLSERKTPLVVPMVLRDVSEDPLLHGGFERESLPDVLRDAIGNIAENQRRYLGRRVPTPIEQGLIAVNLGIDRTFIEMVSQHETDAGLRYIYEVKPGSTNPSDSITQGSWQSHLYDALDPDRPVEWGKTVVFALPSNIPNPLQLERILSNDEMVRSFMKRDGKVYAVTVNDRYNFISIDELMERREEDGGGAHSEALIAA
jgi:hypothetical protein